jgi:hypothetical protein
MLKKIFIPALQVNFITKFEMKISNYLSLFLNDKRFFLFHPLEWE